MTARGLEILAVVALPGVAVWIWRAIFRPQAPCRWCRGRRREGDSERWRNRVCSHCVETPGERTTWGARLVRGGGSKRWGQ